MDTITQSSFFQEIDKELKNKPVVIDQLWDTPKALILKALLQESSFNLLIVSGGERESKLLDDLKYFGIQPRELLSWEALPTENINPSPDIVGDRLSVIDAISSAKVPECLVMNLQAYIQKIPHSHAIKNSKLYLQKDQNYEFEALAKHLADIGYEPVSLVVDKGQFAKRGGLIDVFPVNMPHPFRLDFFDDLLENIKIFDPIGQKSIGQEEAITIHSASELDLTNSGTMSVEALFEDKPLLTVFDGLVELEEKWVNLKSTVTSFKHPLLQDFETILENKKKRHTLFFSDHPLSALTDTSHSSKIGKDFYQAKVFDLDFQFEMFNHTFKAAKAHHPFQKVIDFFDIETPVLLEHQQLIRQNLKSCIDQGFDVSIIVDSDAERNHFADDASGMIDEKDLRFKRGYLSSGLVHVENKTLLFPYTEYSKRHKVTRKKWRSSYHTPVSDFHQLSVGDFVVHLQSGVGKYLGIEKQKNHLGEESEFMVISYAGDSKLFVPLSQSHLVTRFIGATEKAPDLHQLGSSKWKQAKQKAQTAIIGYAKDLLALQAERETVGGTVIAEDSQEMIDFEREFPYEETEDQKRAIEDVRQDLKTKKAMDRLVLGDVGYGKTEVAMRAAFKMAYDGKKQVAVLVPTTILAMQHYESFSARMQNFPVKVDVLCRFKTPKENKATIEALKRGEVDIVIGTHRMLSQDVTFYDLGMMIIDEEQRFGVRAKEKLKKVKAGVEALTLSATPIPRTLYFSIVKARDMSVIASPPHDRLPIKTIISENDDTMIKQAIIRELSRDGQVYYVHNRVESIFEVATHLSTLVPHAKIGVVHGQMDADSIDEKFHLFKQGELDILVATSIVENGIDIANANTIFVDRAHQFGVSDLYQLRGRVGRWNKSAYAYFLVPKNKQLPEHTQKRLQALIESSGHGGGMRLAMMDLEIRGAGDLLGVKQSGHVATVGFHLYCKLLKKAVDALQNNQQIAFIETKLETPYDARIPEEYILEENIRLEFYHRFGEATQDHEIDEIFKEMEDRFGKAPQPAYWLYHLTRLKTYAQTHYFLSIKIQGFNVHVERQVRKKVIKKSFLMPLPSRPEEVELLLKMRLQENFLSY